MTGRDWHNLGESTKKAAIEWHVRLTSDEASEADYEAFSAWIADAPEHFDAYAQVEEFAGRLESLKDTRSELLDRIAAAADLRQRPRRFLARAEVYITAIAATVLVAAAAGLFVFTYAPVEKATYVAQTDQVQNVILSDRTHIALAPGAEVETEIRRKTRRVTAIRGKAFFDVASDESRPFSIALEAQEIRVVGTSFEVTSLPHVRSVAVAEGIVAVGAPGVQFAEEAVRLSAGNQITLPVEGGEQVVGDIDISEIGAWRSGYLEFDRVAIADIADKLNAFYEAPVFSVTDEAAPIAFSGVLVLSDPKGTARRLSELAPIVVTETDTGFLFTPIQPE